MSKKKLEGEIISDKMQKTIVVKVEKIKFQQKYKKRYKVHKKYKAHVDSPAGEGEYKMGDKVMIEECKPISKEKKWRVVSKI